MRSRRLRLSLMTAVVAAASMMTACGSDSDSDQITVAVQPGIPFAPIWVAVDQGFFEDEGLDVETRDVATSAQIIPMTLNGQVQFGAGSLPPLITAIANDIPVKNTTNLLVNSDRTAVVMVPKDSPIRSWKDLEGKRVAVNVQKGALHMADAGAAEVAGVNPDSIEFVPVQFPQMLSSLSSGQVDAVTLIEPFESQAMADGLKVISSPLTEAFGDKSSGATIFASNAYIEDNGETVDKFNAAIANAATFINENPEDAKAILAKYSGMDESVLDPITFDTYTTAFDASSVEAQATMMANLGWIPEAPSVDDVVLESE